MSEEERRPTPDEPGYYQWRLKDQFAAYHKVSLSTIDRRVRSGEVEKTLDFGRPRFRFRAAASESALVPLSDTENGLVPHEAYDLLLAELRALHVKLDAMQQTRHQSPPPRPWWETFRWRKKVDKPPEK